MKILIFTNIPSPYRIDFFNELGKNTELTVVFEAKRAKGIKFNWNIDQINNFTPIFLKEGNIREKKIDWSILKYINRDNYDHIIVTNYGYFTEMLALLALKILKIPYFLEIDGGIIRQENKMKKYYKRFLISNASGYFSPSKSSDDYLMHYGVDKEKIYRYPFTSLKNQDVLTKLVSNEEKITIREKLGITEQKIVLAVGQFIYRKGFDVLLNASSDLDSNIGIILVGGEPPEEYINLKDKYDLNNVYFEGFKSKIELANFFKAADIFVLPTREDIWGLVINEAMAYGLPIITTNKCVAGIELIENNKNGYIITKNNPKSLNKKIKKIIYNKSLMKKMAKNNLNKIRNYTIEAMANKHIEILNKTNYNRN